MPDGSVKTYGKVINEDLYVDRGDTLIRVSDTVNIGFGMNVVNGRLLIDSTDANYINWVIRLIQANAVTNFDTTSLSDRINQKLPISDTPLMLFNYVRRQELKDTARQIREDAGQTVPPDVPNVPPVAVATSTCTSGCNTGVAITLSGSSSTDSDGTIVAYEWQFVSSTNGATVVFPDPSLVSQTFTPSAAGSYSFRLIVTDNDAAKDTADLVIVAVSPTLTARWNFSKTSNVVSGWNNMVAGANAVGNLTSTDASTGWTLTTNAGEWELYFSFFALNNGEGGSSAASPTYTDFPATVLAGGFIQSQHASNNGGANSYPFQIANLPAGTYEVKVISSIKASINSNLPNGRWKFKFGAASETTQTISQQSNNTTNILTFTGTIGSGEVLRFGPFTPNEDTNQATIANAIIITKTN